MEDGPAKQGIALLRSLVKPEWLHQPRADFSFFKEEKAIGFSWKSGDLGQHVYDKRAMYLGASSSVKLGVGIPEHVTCPEIRDTAGLWHVLIDQAPTSPLPPLVKYVDSWQYTPMLLALVRAGYSFQVSEAWLFPEQHELLRPFYEHVRALWLASEGDLDARKQVKRLYTFTFGMLAHWPRVGTPGPNYIYRPDWTFSLVSEAKARMFYQMSKVLEADGLAPTQVIEDCIWYPEQVTALPIGQGIGQYKYNE